MGRVVGDVAEQVRLVKVVVQYPRKALIQSG